jgi:ADP-heptose:LPS heptosyltransferase
MPAVDFQIAAGSLPLHLRRSLADFPNHSGYLKPDPAMRTRWAERYAQLGQGIKVGISWRGGHISQAHKRSTTLDQWQDILRTSGMQWINLQYGSPAQEINDAHERFGIAIHDWDDSDPLTDLDNFAAQIAALDLVISVDNSTVHMAGALGVPVWVLQPYSADWRWLLEREDSHWYPSVRQFRQPAREDWASVLRNAEQQLVLYGASKRINP